MLYAKVIITDLDSNDHTITPSGMGDDDVLEVVFTHKAADDFVLTIGDMTGTVKDWLKRGCITKIYIDTSSPPNTLKLHGMVEDVTLIQPVPGFVLLKAMGRETFHVMINNRIVTETYLDTEVSLIVRDLLKKYAHYEDDVRLAMSFYEGAGDVMHDESIYDNHGTNHGAAWADGKYGKALSLDGTNYVSVADDESLNLSLPITIAAWVKRTDDFTGPAYIIRKSENYGAYCDATEELHAIFNDGANWRISDSGYTMPLNTWVFVVVTFVANGANTDVTFYINGAKFGTTITETGQPVTDVDILSIGSQQTGIDRWIGLIDEVYVRSDAPTADDIKAQNDYPYLHYIDVTTTTPDDIRFPYRPLRECLDELARLSVFTYYGNPNSVMRWVEEKTEDSGFTYTEANIEASPEVIESLMPIKNRVYVLGGNYMQEDQEQLTHAATKNTKDKWYAQSFTPTRSELDQVSLYIKRTGAPDDLEGEIRTDDPGNGPDEKLATFAMGMDFIGTTESWRPAAVDAQILIGTKYWIVLKKTGDAGNNYEWYHDNGAAGEYADSDDGVTWAVHNGGDLQFAFKTHYAIPIMAVKSDFAHSVIYKWRETVIEDKGIMSRTLARETAKTKLSDLKDMTAQIREIKIGDANGIPDLGKLVTITLTNQGIVGVQYVAKEAKIKFKGGEGGAFSIALRLGRDASELAEYIRDLKAEVDRTKVGAYGVDRGLINLVRNFTDTAEATDANLVGTVQNTGTFLIDTARIDFSDIG